MPVDGTDRSRIIQIYTKVIGYWDAGILVYNYKSIDLTKINRNNEKDMSVGAGRGALYRSRWRGAHSSRLLGRELLDQLLQRRQLPPLDQVELLRTHTLVSLFISTSSKPELSVYTMRRPHGVFNFL